MKKTLIALMALAGVAMAGETYWSFEDTTSSAGENAYTGKITSTVTMENTTATTGSVLGNDSTANLGYSMSFVDGSYIQYSNADLGLTLKYGNDTTLSYTIMAYVKFDNVNGEQFFFGTGQTNSSMGIGLGIKNGKLDWLSKTVDHYTFDYTVESDTWYHLAFAYDHNDNTVEAFVNGTSAGSVTLSNGMAGPGNSAMTNHVTIGAASANENQDNFAGAVAHLQIITGEALGADAVVQYASNIIPEPATATLSLLALAGLAARRRRK